MRGERKETRGKDRLDDLEHADELSRMRYRLHGLHAAISHMAHQDAEGTGVIQLSDDICIAMDACADAFTAERELRIRDAGVAHV